MKFKSILRMQRNSGEWLEFDSGEHDSAALAMEAQCPKIGATLGISAEDAGCFLADMELQGKLDERYFKDGIEIPSESIADYL